MTGQDGNIHHLQVSTLLPSQPQSQPRYNYINPDSWSSQVEDFLTRPRANKRKAEEETSGVTERVKRNNFTARAPVLPPSPSSRANEVDSRPESKLHRGEIGEKLLAFNILSSHLLIPFRIEEASLASSGVRISRARYLSTARTLCPGGRE